MSSSKKIYLKKGLLSEFIDWRYSQSCWYFRSCIVNCCHSNLLSSSISLSPPPFLVWISMLYTVCKGGGRYDVLGLIQMNTRHKVPLQVKFFRWRHFALPSMSLIFLCRVYSPCTGCVSTPQEKNEHARTCMVCRICCYHLYYYYLYAWLRNLALQRQLWSARHFERSAYTGSIFYSEHGIILATSHLSRMPLHDGTRMLAYPRSYKTDTLVRLHTKMYENGVTIVSKKNLPLCRYLDKDHDEG